MRRTQLYLDEDLWDALRIRSRESGLTLSELVRQAVRERYMTQSARRKEAMLAFAGSRKGRNDMNRVDTYIRRLRRGNRLARLSS